MRSLWLLPLLILAACGAQPQVVVSAPPEVVRTPLRDLLPDNELKCLREPNGANVTTVRQSAKYVIDLKKAGADCRQKLSSVRDIIQTER